MTSNLLMSELESVISENTLMIVDLNGFYPSIIDTIIDCRKNNSAALMTGNHIVTDRD